MGPSSQQPQRQGRLPLHNRHRPRQAQAPLPCPLDESGDWHEWAAVAEIMRETSMRVALLRQRESEPVDKGERIGLLAQLPAFCR